MILLISPSVGGVGFAEYVCAHPRFTNYFTEEDPDYIPEDVELVVPYTQPCLCTQGPTESFHGVVL
jgi:hypothetical protein